MLAHTETQHKYDKCGTEVVLSVCAATNCTVKAKTPLIAYYTISVLLRFELHQAGIAPTALHIAIMVIAIDECCPNRQL